MRSVKIMLAASVLGLCCASSSVFAAQISCFSPNGKIAGRGTPNPNHLPVVAHKKLAFGTIVRLSTSRGSVDSIVMDRGPYKGNREYDAECWVLRRLGIDGVGNAHVQILGR